MRLAIVSNRHHRIQVVSVVRDGGVEAMLDDPDFTTATNEIPADLPRAEIDALRKKKDAAMQRLLEKYAVILLS